MLKTLTSPNIFRLISFSSVFLVRTTGVVVGVDVVVSVTFDGTLVEFAAVNDSFAIRLAVAESGTMLLLIIAVICLIADAVSLIA